jgi:hypothetical protein
VSAQSTQPIPEQPSGRVRQEARVRLRSSGCGAGGRAAQQCAHAADRRLQAATGDPRVGCIAHHARKHLLQPRVVLCRGSHGAARAPVITGAVLVGKKRCASVGASALHGHHPGGPQPGIAVLRCWRVQGQRGRRHSTCKQPWPGVAGMCAVVSSRAGRPLPPPGLMSWIVLILLFANLC